MRSDAPRVTVVVPVYNAADYLRECIDSILGQTFGDFELICVNDGSTDDSLSILSSYAQTDGRVRVFSQENHGAGVARNAGIAVARGEFLFFMDSDDYCSPALLQKLVESADRNQSDVVMTGLAVHSALDGSVYRPDWDYDWRFFPVDRSFTWRDCPDRLFSAFHNYAWNKMVRASFVREHRVMFPTIHLTEDLMWSAPILVLAQRMSYVNEPLVVHRDGTGTNTMSYKSLHPFDFAMAFRALKDFLEAHGVYDELRRAYVNWAGSSCFYNLMTIADFGAFSAVLHYLQDGGLTELGLCDVPPDMWDDAHTRTFIDHVACDEPAAFLHYYYMEARSWNDRSSAHLQAAWDRERACEERCAELERRVAELQEAARGMEHSAEMRVGRALCKFPRFVKRLLSGRKAMPAVQGDHR